MGPIFIMARSPVVRRLRLLNVAAGLRCDADPGRPLRARFIGLFFIGVLNPQQHDTDE
jgi:hypothetical protein